MNLQRITNQSHNETASSAPDMRAHGGYQQAQPNSLPSFQFNGESYNQHISSRGPAPGFGGRATSFSAINGSSSQPRDIPSKYGISDVPPPLPPPQLIPIAAPTPTHGHHRILEKGFGESHASPGNAWSKEQTMWRGGFSDRRKHRPAGARGHRRANSSIDSTNEDIPMEGVADDMDVDMEIQDREDRPGPPQSRSPYFRGETEHRAGSITQPDQQLPSLLHHSGTLNVAIQKSSNDYDKSVLKKLGGLGPDSEPSSPFARHSVPRVTSRNFHPIPTSSPISQAIDRPIGRYSRDSNQSHSLPQTIPIPIGSSGEHSRWNRNVPPIPPMNMGMVVAPQNYPPVFPPSQLALPPKREFGDIHRPGSASISAQNGGSRADRRRISPSDDNNADSDNDMDMDGAPQVNRMRQLTLQSNTSSPRPHQIPLRTFEASDHRARSDTPPLEERERQYYLSGQPYPNSEPTMALSPFDTSPDATHRRGYAIERRGRFTGQSGRGGPASPLQNPASIASSHSTAYSGRSVTSSFADHASSVTSVDTEEYDRLSPAGSARLLGRPQHHRTMSDATITVLKGSSEGTLQSEYHSAPQKGSFTCECCPKKPRKFDTAFELSEHESEKQYKCNWCLHRFKNKNEAERHQNSLHLRKYSWSCGSLTKKRHVFHPHPERPHEFDVCGYCGENFPIPADWPKRKQHVKQVHRFAECNLKKKFFRADHFRQHLKHSHGGESGRHANVLENVCRREEPMPAPAHFGGDQSGGE